MSSLFTEEHFRTIAAHLKPGGLAVQWFHLYERSDDLVDLVLRTFERVFPNVRIFGERLQIDLLLVGSLEPIDPDLDALAARFATRAVQNDLLKDGVADPATFLYLELYGPAEARLLPGRGPIHRDDLPLLEHEAPRERRRAPRPARLCAGGPRSRFVARPARPRARAGEPGGLAAGGLARRRRLIRAPACPPVCRESGSPRSGGHPARPCGEIDARGVSGRVRVTLVNAPEG